MPSRAASTPIDFAERLRLWRVSRNLTQMEAAEQLDIDRGYLSQVECGRAPGKRLRTRFYLAEQSASERTRAATAGNGPGLRHLPVLSCTQAALLHTLDDPPAPGSELVPSDVPDDLAFGLRLRGDSMEPRFSEGDIAILTPGTAPANGDVVVANLKNQGVLCKIMHVQLDKNLVKLSSYHAAYPPTEYRREEFHWIVPVEAIVRQLRRS
jgi:SOS-response transcriptional repressor LexA